MKNGLYVNPSDRRKRTFNTTYENQSESTIALTHPQYRGRSDRLDLISNRMLGIRASIEGKSFTICDISETGFSYAEKVPVQQNLSYNQVKFKVDKIATSNYGKRISCMCYFQGESSRGGIKANGIIRNHQLFLILSTDEIKTIVTKILNKKSIKRSHDPDNYYGKLDTLLDSSKRAISRGCESLTLSIALNITFRNLILEIGVSNEVFNNLFSGFINKPVYVKYGVSIENLKEAKDFLQFAKNKNAFILKVKNSADGDRRNRKLALVKKVNQKYSFQDFVKIVWRNCLKYFELESTGQLPKIENAKLANKIVEEKKQFDGHLEKLGDEELKEGDSKGIENYIINGLYWNLIEIDKKYFDREVIRKYVKKVIFQSFKECLQLSDKKN